jgi:capsule polysaccharide export protein KpsE/RkpR
MKFLPIFHLLVLKLIIIYMVFSHFKPNGNISGMSGKVSQTSGKVSQTSGKVYQTSGKVSQYF